MERKPDTELLRGILLLRATALAALLQHRAGHSITKDPLYAQARIIDVLVVELDGMTSDEILIGLVIESPVLSFSPDHHEPSGLPFISPPFLQANPDTDPLDLGATMPHAGEVLDVLKAKASQHVTLEGWPHRIPPMHFPSFRGDAGLCHHPRLIHRPILEALGVFESTCCFCPDCGNEVSPYDVSPFNLVAQSVVHMAAKDLYADLLSGDGGGPVPKIALPGASFIHARHAPTHHVIDPKRPSTWQRPDPAATAEQLMYVRVLVMGRDLFGEITGFVKDDVPTEGAYVKFEPPYDEHADAERVDFDRLRIPPPGL